MQAPLAPPYAGPVPLHDPPDVTRRPWLVPICVIGLATSVARPAAAMPVPAVVVTALVESVEAASPAAERVPAIGADAESLGDHLRSSERAELLIGAARASSHTGPRVMPDTTRATSGDIALAARRAHRGSTWCDVVQCRRLAGAQLLRYAMPPPRG